MEEDHDRIEELLAGYVLLGLSGEDATRADGLLSEHLPSCPLCRDTLTGFQAVVGELGLATSPARPPDLVLPRIGRGAVSGIIHQVEIGWEEQWFFQYPNWVHPVAAVHGS